MTRSLNEHLSWSLPALNSLFVATLILVSMLAASSADLTGFSLTLVFVLFLVAGFITGSSLIVRSEEWSAATRLTASAGMAAVAGLMIGAEHIVPALPPIARQVSGRAGMISLAWLAAVWINRSLDAPRELVTAEGQDASTASGKSRWAPAFSIATGLLLLLAAVESVSAVGGSSPLGMALLVGPGLYHVILAACCALACWGGVILERRGLARPEPPVTNLQRDRLLIERWGGRVLAASGLGASLVCLQAAQSALAIKLGSTATGAAAASKPIGPFDLLTWLGTLGTLVVVIAGALVAMYVKRRDDESQHGAAVTSMRQEWINRSRTLLSELLALGERLRAKMDAGAFDPELAAGALERLRAIELQLNPVETMPRVLLSALKSWLLEAGLYEHGRSSPSPRTSNLGDFQVTTDWLVGLGQLVLKTEWAVTSVGRGRVLEKLQETWLSLINYEQNNREEIRRIAPEALHIRETTAPTILTLVSAGSPSASHSEPRIEATPPPI